MVVANAEQALEVSPRSTVTIGSDELLKGFYDVAYVYRFGPPKHETVIATLLDADDNIITEAFYFPGARKTDMQQHVSLTAAAVELESGDYLLELETDTLLQAVHFDVKGYYASDEYFHLAPGRRKQILLRKNVEPAKKFRGYVESISLNEAVSITITK